MPDKYADMKVMLNTNAVWPRLTRLHMSQNKLARLVRVSPSHMSRIINGRRCPSPDLRRRIAEALGCPEFDELFVLVSADE